MERKLLIVLVVSLLAISLVQTSFIYFKSVSLVETPQVTGKATIGSGQITLCANNPPLLAYGCNTTLRQDQFYSCTLNASDPNNDSMIFSLINTSGNIGGSIDLGGTFSITPTQEMTGASTIRFTATDNSSCLGNNGSIDVNFTVTDVNDPPVYDVAIGSLSWTQGATYRGLFLDDHFTDPDGDILSYTYFSLSSGFSISIVGGTSEAIISHSSCGDGSIVFQAIDPFNLTATSGVIPLSVQCEDDDDSGGGGGGGGSFSSCKTEWQCLDWDRCLFNNTQKKLCTDINGCADPYQRNFWQECTYIAHCYNGILDLDEQGVDCGGDDCEECQTCTDGILNNYEVEVDCGGPNCGACSSCFDGIQNYQETGIDCGGPACDACPTCEDGIQNQNETGIDCGGPYCGACTRIETPSLVDGLSDEDRFNIVLIGSFLGIAVLAVSYRLFKKQLHALVAALLLAAAMKKRKQVLFSQEQKEFLFSRLKEIEKKDFLAKSKLVKHQDFLSRLQRQFFSFLIDSAADTQLINERIEKLSTTKAVKEMLKHQYTSLMKLERKKGLTKLDLMLHTEFFRSAIITLCTVKKEDISRDVDELKSYKKPSTDVIKQFLYNGTLALQFSQVAVAREKYMAALKLYESLPLDVQKEVYDELMLNFNQLAYASSFMN